MANIRRMYLRAEMSDGDTVELLNFTVGSDGKVQKLDESSMVQQFKSLLLSLVKCEDSRALVQQAYNRFSDVLYGKAMELAMAEDRKRASITKAAGIGRLLLRVRSFLLPRRRRQ